MLLISACRLSGLGNQSPRPLPKRNRETALFFLHLFVSLQLVSSSSSAVTPLHLSSAPAPQPLPSTTASRLWFSSPRVHQQPLLPLYTMAGKPRQQDKKRGGFKVGPKLGKGVYQGHGTLHLVPLAHSPFEPKLTLSHPSTAAKKIKETLIHKAKVKKSYHKALAAEGYATGANGGGLGQRKAGKQQGGRGGVDSDEEEDGEEDAEMEGALGEEEKEEQRRKLRQELEGAQGMESDEEGGSDSDDDDEGGRGGGRQPKFVKQPVREPLPEIAYPGPTKGNGSRRAPPADAAPSPAPTAPPKKRGPPELTARQPKKPKLTEKEIETIREKKAAERKEWGKKGARGQPKLGGRVEQLLGRIQRSMA
jgi:hypothetical protein